MDVLLCFVVYKYGERIIDWIWEDKGINVDVVLFGSMKMVVYVDFLIEEEGGGV